MAPITDFAGGHSPVLGNGPNRRAGPANYRVVRLHTNVPPSSHHKMPKDHVPQGARWVAPSSWRPLPTGS